MKPWREVAVPHPDVLEGTFQQSEFAADITEPGKSDWAFDLEVSGREANAAV